MSGSSCPWSPSTFPPSRDGSRRPPSSRDTCGTKVRGPGPSTSSCGHDNTRTVGPQEVHRRVLGSQETSHQDPRGSTTLRVHTPWSSVHPERVSSSPPWTSPRVSRVGPSRLPHLPRARLLRARFRDPTRPANICTYLSPSPPGRDPRRTRPEDGRLVWVWTGQVRPSQSQPPRPPPRRSIFPEPRPVRLRRVGHYFPRHSPREEDSLKILVTHRVRDSDPHDPTQVDPGLYRRRVRSPRETGHGAQGSRDHPRQGCVVEEPIIHPTFPYRLNPQSPTSLNSSRVHVPHSFDREICRAPGLESRGPDGGARDLPPSTCPVRTCPVSDPTVCEPPPTPRADGEGSWQSRVHSSLWSGRGSRTTSRLHLWGQGV